MTDSFARTLRCFGDLVPEGRFLAGLAARDVDVLLRGEMFMTEREAGSVIAATRVGAEPVKDGVWLLRGDKWFCSDPDADLAMVLARIPKGPPGIKGVATRSASPGTWTSSARAPWRAGRSGWRGDMGLFRGRGG